MIRAALHWAGEIIAALLIVASPFLFIWAAYVFNFAGSVTQ